MKRKTKINILIVITGIVVFIGYIIFSFYLMTIEDHYGDLQNVYFSSKNGDLIFNKSTKKIGTIKKDWKTIHVIEKNNQEIDLFNWVYVNGKETEVEIYRPKTEFNTDNEVEYDEIQDKVKFGEIEKIIID